MLKTISVALVAVSVLAAPALAGTPGKTVRTHVNKVTQAPVAKVQHGKAKLLNANARMGRHHKHYRHHRHHKHIGLHKTHVEHIAIKHVTPSAKTRLNPIRRARVSPPLPARALRMTDQPTRHLLC
jgi:hypothetical protein